MIKQYIAIFIFSCMGCPFCYMQGAAQSPCMLHFSGKVHDKNTQEPLSYVQVGLKSTERGIITDSLGHFAFENLCPGAHTFDFHHISYEALHVDVYLVRNTDTLLYMHTDYTSLSTVLVEGEHNKTSRNVPSATLDKKDLLETPDKSLSELLEIVPGVSALYSGSGISKPIVQGLYSTRVSILHHEILQEDQQWGLEHMPNIDPHLAKKIQVIKGVGFLHYGAGTSGGVIALESEDLPYGKKGLGGHLMTHYASNGHQGTLYGELTGAFPFERQVAGKAQFTIKRGGDRHAPEYTLENTGLAEVDASFELGFRHKVFTSELYYSLFSHEGGILRSSHVGSATDLQDAINRQKPFYTRDFTYQIDAPRQDLVHQLLKAKTDINLSERLIASLIYGYQENHRQEFARRRSGRSYTPALDLKLYTHSINLIFDRFAPSAKHKTSFGVSMQHQENRNQPGTGTLPFLPNYNRRIAGTSLTQNLWLGDRSELELGLRYDYFWRKAFLLDRRGRRERFVHVHHLLSAALGIHHKLLDEHWSLGLHSGWSTRAPHASERYSDGIHHSAASIEEGNPNLQTERSLKSSLHVHASYPQWSLHTSLFAQWIDNFIFQEPAPKPRLTIRGAFPVFEYKQADATLRGADVKLKIKALTWLAYEIGGAIIRGHNEETDMPLIYMPSNHLEHALTLQAPLKAHDLSLKMSHKAVAKQRRHPDNVDLLSPPQGYHLLDLALDYTRRLKSNAYEWHARLGVENLLNTTYRKYLNRFRYYADEPGRQFQASLRFAF